MQAYPQYQSAIDYIFGATNTFTNGTYESLPNINLVKTASVRSIEMVSNLIRISFYCLFQLIKNFFFNLFRNLIKSCLCLVNVSKKKVDFYHRKQSI